MAADFGQGGKSVTAPSQLAVNPEHQRQGARDQPQIIEVGMKKREVERRLEKKAVQRVSQASGEEQSVTMERECLHSRARMKKPTTAAIASFSRNKLMPGR